MMEHNFNPALHAKVLLKNFVTFSTIKNNKLYVELDESHICGLFANIYNPDDKEYSERLFAYMSQKEYIIDQKGWSAKKNGSERCITHKFELTLKGVEFAYA